MEEKKYLKWYNKIGYGSGDIAGNVVYAFLTSFVMVYLTDTIGLASGIVGTLIAVSKLLDGFTDIFFGSMIDKTHSKMGKARPWMLYGYIGSLFYSSNKSWQDGTVCVVLYCVYAVEWRVLYGK